LSTIFFKPAFLWVFKKFGQVNVVEQVESTEASEVRESPFALDFLLYYGQQKVNDERTPDLYFDGIFIVAKEKL
jgi:hypothetical protein